MSMPQSYNDINEYNARISPSTFHASNTVLSEYFRNYLLQKAMSVFEFKIPKDWSKNYFLYSLYGFGYVAVFNTDKFGVIFQPCGLYGFDVYYQPTNALIANPLLTGILQPRIGLQCSLIKLQPNYHSIMDIIGYYGDIMALCAETAGMNIVNSKLSYVFFAETKVKSESFKKIFDDINAGNPAVVADSKLMNEDGRLACEPFTQNLRENFIAGEILDVLRRVECMFATDIGIPNANTDKKERLIQKEVDSNNIETQSKCELWLESLQEGFEQARKMFSFSESELSVDWRYKPTVEVEKNANDGISTGNV